MLGGDELGEEAVEGVVEVGGVAGMRARGGYRGASDGRKPSEAFVGFEGGDGA